MVLCDTIIRPLHLLIYALVMNIQGIYGVAGLGSWKLVLDGVTHLDFLDGGKLLNTLFKSISAIKWPRVLPKDGEAEEDAKEAALFW